MKPKVLFFSTLAALLLHTNALAAATSEYSWTDRIEAFFTDLFGWEEEEPELSAFESPVAVDLPNWVAGDTTATDWRWPAESYDVAAELERERRLFGATELVRDPFGLVPLTARTPGIRVVYRESQRPARMLEFLRRFAPVQFIAYSDKLAPALAAAKTVPTVIVSDDPVGAVEADSWYRALYGLDDVIMVHFGDANLIGETPADWTVINSPLRSKETERSVAQLIFGAKSVAEDSTSIPGWRLPEDVGIDRTQFERIDRTIKWAIGNRAMPGAQLAVLKDGHLIYEQAYGKQTYRRDGTRVTTNDLYDLASITKAAATTLATMKLYEEGKLKLDDRVADHLPEYAGKVIGLYRVEQLLSHHTGLQPDLPIAGFLGEPFVSATAMNGSLALSTQRWLDPSVPARLRAMLTTAEFTRRPVYRYSDINFVLLQYIVEAISHQPLDVYVHENFYEPMGLTHLVFNPHTTDLPRERFVPTVTDRWIGRGALRGFVHDEGAAFMGGVAGHAGLFGNAADVGRLFQMLIDGGSYGDTRLLDEETVTLFTDRNRFNNRALGFDRLATGYNSVVRAGASEATFGHTGFTGTSVWADPDNDLVFVLLTNRVHPDPANKRFMERRVRGYVHRYLYRALGSYHPELAAA